jgi:hypothetical protein
MVTNHRCASAALITGSSLLSAYQERKAAMS